ncbi:hypothetical protein B7P33_17175 [Sediminicola luteus]|uniref:Conjugative transposon TraM C-terminal domain-containing protein n=2 Tax=Sediminicola luteus TaxID=319238 RepID=A0A2A4G4U5_9FLAO|nr:hypothetical protein B7P33_17175 [Sediminicola luteus]
MTLMSIYGIWIFREVPMDSDPLKGTGIPGLLGDTLVYSNRKQALDAWKGDKELSLPELAQTGNPDLEQGRLDSLYAKARRVYHGHKGNGNRVPQRRIVPDTATNPRDNGPVPKEGPIDVQAFFPESRDIGLSPPIEVRVLGDQRVRAGMLLRMQLMVDVPLGRDTVPKYTTFYGKVGLAPYRLLVEVGAPFGHALEVTAYDPNDGWEGLPLDGKGIDGAPARLGSDALDRVQVPGLPELRGLRNLLKRDLSKLTVTVPDRTVLELRKKQNE